MSKLIYTGAAEKLGVNECNIIIRRHINVHQRPRTTNDTVAAITSLDLRESVKTAKIRTRAGPHVTFLEQISQRVYHVKTKNQKRKN